MITHGSTFSGIGAPEVAAEMLGWTNVFHCEINPFGRSVLDYYFPKAKSYEDITNTDFSEWRGKVTVLTGGFPCQPFSYAGKRRGSEDDRYLWPYMLKCIEQVRPTWFIGENVAGITTMVFPGEDVKVGSTPDLFGEGDDIIETRERYVLDEICSSLEGIGYTVQPLLIPACAVEAPHRRDRVFIIAHRATANTACSGSGTQEPCGGIEGNRRNGLSHQSERRNSTERTDGLSEVQRCTSYATSERRREIYESLQPKQPDGAEPERNGREQYVANTRCEDVQAGYNERGNCIEDRETSGRSCGNSSESIFRNSNSCNEYSQREIFGRKRTESSRICEELLPENRWRAFPTQSPVYRGNDGLPFDVDNLTIPFGEWKRESLKAYGNAIVPQVMYEIFRCIDEIEATNAPLSPEE